MQIIETSFLAQNTGHYSPGIISNGFVFISGQLSINPENGKIPQGGVKEEAKQALKNLDNVLIAAGVTRKNVIQCRIYIPDVTYWSDLNEVYSDFFGNHKPARIVVPSNKLHSGCLVEIEAIAQCMEVR